VIVHVTTIHFLASIESFIQISESTCANFLPKEQAAEDFEDLFMAIVQIDLAQQLVGSNDEC
jgi:hypothetical protein